MTKVNAVSFVNASFENLNPIINDILSSSKQGNSGSLPSTYDSLCQGALAHMSGSELDERRPRPIGVEEESDDDESDRDVVNNNANGAKAASTIAAAAAAPDEKEGKKKAASRRLPAFSENNLVMAKGLIKIYEEFPQKCQYKGRGREVGRKCSLSCWTKLGTFSVQCVTASAL